MVKYDFSIQLTSDCEAGSGFGSELLNSLVPRDAGHQPYIPASHVKGLMRDRFRMLTSVLLPDIAERMEDALFGREGQAGDEGICGSIRLSDARGKDVKTIRLTRTALGESGTAQGHTLRTTEAMSVGSTFEGALSVEGEDDGWMAIGARLALLSVMAIGGNRTRGSGACLAKIRGREETPGTLLKKLDEAIGSQRIEPVLQGKLSNSVGMKLSGERVFVKLVFKASAPVCCPETPVVGNNVIRSGFSVPASAVQGALLTRLNAVDPELATACFESHDFRVWPMHPAEKDEQMSYRVSATHKVGKLPDKDGRYTFEDLFLKDYDWTTEAQGAPLKASDGVLLQPSSGPIRLWRSADMPRIVTGHAVHHDPEKTRNLFTIEAMAPMTYVGLAAVPKEAVEKLQALFTKDATVVFGKARTVRGEGCLGIEQLPLDQILYPASHTLGQRVFILQSPIAVPVDLRNKGLCAEDILARIVKDAGWGKVEMASAALGVQFGWNRHGKGQRVGGSKRLEAVSAVMPGSVFKLEQPVDELPGRLAAGFGLLKEQGFGAVLPHPGEAGFRFGGMPVLPKDMQPAGNASRTGWELYKKAGARLSPSQIAAFATRVAVGKEAARKYLDDQIRGRPKAISDKWRKIEETLLPVIERSDATDVIDVWRNLAQAGKEEKEAKR